MSGVELLNAADHADLRLADGPARSHWQGFVELVLAELPAAAAHYPLFFAKDADTGRFRLGMLHGIQGGEPMRDDEDARSIGFVPAALKRQGFFAAGQDLAVDRGDARLAAGQGSPLFQGDGRPAAALREVQQAIFTLKSGRAETDAFIAALLRHKLIEAVDIALDFDSGEHLTLQGLYTVSLDQLGALEDAAVLALFRADQLRPAYAIPGSFPRLAVLAHGRNRGPDI